MKYEMIFGDEALFDDLVKDFKFGSESERNNFKECADIVWQAATKSAVPQWIPVGERLPDFDGGPYVSRPVLAFDKYDDVVFAKYVKSGYWVILYIDERREHGEITHWMPLPAAPEIHK